MDAGIDGIIGEPLRLGILAGDDFLQPRTGRRGAALGEQGQAFALIRGEFLRERIQKSQGIGAGNFIAGGREAAGAVNVIKIEDGSLRKAVGAAVAVREQGVAFDLDRAAFVGLGHQRHGTRARGHGRGEVFRRAKSVVLGLLTVRDQLFLGPAAVGTHHRHAREGKGGGHDLEEMAAGGPVFQFARALGKFPVQPFLELRRVSQFVQTAPVTAAGDGEGGLGIQIFHR